MARFLIWIGKSANPTPKALGGDMELVDSIHLGGDTSGSGALRRLLRPRTMSPGSRSLIDILAVVPATPVSLSQACAQGRRERATIALGFLCQGTHPPLGSDNCNRESPDRHGWYPFAMVLISPPWSGQPADRSKAISLPTNYYVARASRSCFSCSSGRLVEMISKSYCLSSSMILSGAVAPLVKANRAEVPSVTFSRTCLMKSSLMPTSAIEPAPMAAPIAAPRKGTKKMSPNRNPQKAPPRAPEPPCSWRVVGFLFPWGQLTTAASSRLIICCSCSPCRARSTRSAP